MWTIFMHFTQNVLCFVYFCFLIKHGRSKYCRKFSNTTKSLIQAWNWKSFQAAPAHLTAYQLHYNQMNSTRAIISHVSPGRHANFRNEKCTLLPSDLSKADIHEMYNNVAEQASFRKLHYNQMNSTRAIISHVLVKLYRKTPSQRVPSSRRR